MAIVRNETDSRISIYMATEVSTVATTVTLIDMAGLPAPSLYIANKCTAAITYIIKGCYDKNVTATQYWYPIASGTAAAAVVTCVGTDGAGGISALGNRHKALTVEIVATAATSGILVMQLGAW